MLLSFLYVGFSGAMSIWMPSYVSERFHIHGFGASLLVSGLWVGIYPGKARLLLPVLAVPAQIAAGVQQPGSSDGCRARHFPEHLSLADRRPCPVGFLRGGHQSARLSLLTGAFPGREGSASAALTFFGTLGLMVVPGVSGFVAEKIDFWCGVLTICLCPCGLAVLSMVLMARGEHDTIGIRHARASE